jgi:hypothetical protein
MNLNEVRFELDTNPLIRPLIREQLPLSDIPNTGPVWGDLMINLQIYHGVSIRSIAIWPWPLLEEMM